MQDEVLAHRLGLIPLTADPRQFTYPGPEWSPETGTERDTLEFSLEVKCTKDPVTPGQFVDSHVLTDKLIWVPRGDQDTWLTDPGPQQKDILINKLRPGHEMEIKLFAVKLYNSRSILFDKKPIFIRVWAETTLNSLQWPPPFTG